MHKGVAVVFIIIFVMGESGESISIKIDYQWIIVDHQHIQSDIEFLASY